MNFSKKPLWGQDKETSQLCSSTKGFVAPLKIIMIKLRELINQSLGKTIAPNWW